MSQSGQFSLLGQRRFAPFFWTQFLGAFNDNVFKTALITVVTYRAAQWAGGIDSDLLTNLIPGLFILPFVVISATAGQLADKYDKGRIVRYVKLLEIAIMLLASLGWMTQNLWLLLTAVLGMGVHSAFFGPVKYAYLPQHLRSDELVGGNGLVEMGTFVGILLGEVLGASIVLNEPGGVQSVALVTVVLAMVGWFASRAIPASPAPAPDLRINWNPFTEMVRNLRFSSQNRVVFLSLLGNSWFWFYGAIILAQFPLYAKNYLHGDHNIFVLLLTVFSVGVGSGSLLCEKLSGHKVEIGLVPFGSIGLSVFGLDLYFASHGYAPVAPGAAELSIAAFLAHGGSWHILFDCLAIGLFGGFYIVPLFALIQTRCDPAHMSRTIAGMNILNALFMVVAALLAAVLLKSGWAIPDLFLLTAGLNALVAFYVFGLVPEFLIRFLAWMLLQCLHRVRGINLDAIPDEGPALLVCNHVSYVDALVIGAASPRPIRFVMDHRIFNTPILGWLFRASKTIPIAPAKEDQWIMEKAYIDIAKALHEGDLVCIFPEGKLTKTGEIDVFKGGVMKILERSKVAVIPMALRGLWGSMLTRGEGNPFNRSFKRGPWSKLELVVGESLAPENVNPEMLRDKVAALRGEWK
jgi:1-acyl-sn-glycerol-3-phosphate acyltransferase